MKTKRKSIFLFRSILIIMALCLNLFNNQLILAVENSSISGNNDIGGVIGEDLILIIENSPYIVKESIIIPEGITVNINEGVELKFAENTNMDVRGRLIINGSMQSHVTFDSLEENKWDSVMINSNDNEIKYLDIINAKEGLKISEDNNKIYNVKTIDCDYNLDLYTNNYDTPNIKKSTYTSSVNKYDINKDKSIDLLDLSSLGVAYNKKYGDESFDELSDINEDGIIDIYDMVSVAKHIGADDTKLYGRTIIIDPGHGGDEPGASYYGHVEKDINLTLSQKLRDELMKYGAEVVMVRNSDITIELEDRIKFVNSVEADLLLSMHHDASQYSSVKGMSTHYSTYRPAIETKDAYAIYNKVKCKFISEDDGYANIVYRGVNKRLSFKYSNFTIYDPTPSSEAIASEKLGKNIVDSLASLGFNNRGIRDHNLYMTRWAKMPSILVEAGFISNKDEANKVTSPDMQKKIASKIATEVVNYLK